MSHTFKTIGSKLAISRWLSKKKIFLPMTKPYIDLEMENIRNGKG